MITDYNNQIEELARKICKLSENHPCEDCVAAKWCTLKKHVKEIIEAGYCDRNAIINEIFSDLKAFIDSNKAAQYSPVGNYLGQCVELGLFVDKFDELQKKYKEKKDG